MILVVFLVVIPTGALQRIPNYLHGPKGFTKGIISVHCDTEMVMPEYVLLGLSDKFGLINHLPKYIPFSLVESAHFHIDLHGRPLWMSLVYFVWFAPPR